MAAEPDSELRGVYFSMKCFDQHETVDRYDFLQKTLAKYPAIFIPIFYNLHRMTRKRKNAQSSVLSP